MKLIDPIVIKEEQQRLNFYKEELALGVVAGDALKWFKNYAINKKPEEIAEIKLRLVAHATADAKLAEHYIMVAAKQYVSQIILSAIETAQQEFDKSTLVRKKISEALKS